MPIFGHSKFIPVFLEKLSEKIGTAIFGSFKFIQVFWEKLSEKHSEWPFLAIPNYTSLLEKFSMTIFWPFQISSSLFGENC